MGWRHNRWLSVHSFMIRVKPQFPYELSFLSVFWITSKSNQKYMLDVVNEVFSRYGSTKTRHREASWLLNSIYSWHHFIYVSRKFRMSRGSPNYQIRYRKHSMTDTEWMHSFSTYSQEPRNQRALYHLCSFVFTYAEIKSNNKFNSFLCAHKSLYMFLFVQRSLRLSYGAKNIT